MGDLNEIGVLGLGVMGANLARNLASRGFKVAGYNRNPERALALGREHPEAGLALTSSLEAFTRGLARPRKLILLVSAGPAVDAVLAQLDPLLEAGDVVVDAGNSLFSDTERRIREPRAWAFLGMGVSGGEEGALRGPAIMPGGDKAAYETLKPFLEAIAARSASGPCVAYCGSGSAGHFVKMVHNGIEYGDMQLIAETALLLRQGLGLTATQAAEVFEDWNRGDLESYLVEITARILRTPDPQGRDGAPLVDAILDRAAQKGTGRWTVMAAAELGVPIPTIAAAVEARSLSADKARRVLAAQLFPGSNLAGFGDLGPGDLRDALYASKIASYTQGFDLLRKASDERRYGTSLSEVARIWTAGCIIRARFLDEVARAFSPGGAVQEPGPELLAFAPFFAEALARRTPAWRKVVAAAALAGLPTPGLAASLAWFDTLRTSPGSASLIQAQRDYFGAHTYERLDHPGQAVHTAWPGTSLDNPGGA
jgi:6-phosphogluconate dehydrogenase